MNNPLECPAKNFSVFVRSEGSECTERGGRDFQNRRRKDRLRRLKGDRAKLSHHVTKLFLFETWETAGLGDTPEAAMDMPEEENK